MNHTVPDFLVFYMHALSCGCFAFFNKTGGNRILNVVITSRQFLDGKICCITIPDLRCLLETSDGTLY